MNYAYVVETQKGETTKKNQGLFLKIQALAIPEDNIFIEQNPADKVEFGKMLDVLQPEDSLLIRSILDLDTDLDFLKNDILPYLQSQRVSIISCEEPFLDGLNYTAAIDRIAQLMQIFSQQKKKESYQKAVREKRVGRPPVKDGGIRKALDLYHSGKYKTSEILKITGVSKSTLYRHIKEQKVSV